MKNTMLFLIFLTTSFLFAQDGSLDTSFGNNGVVELPFYDEPEYIQDFAISESEIIYVSGRTDNPNTGETEYFLIAFDDLGSVETGFGTNGRLLSDTTSFGKVYTQGKFRVLLHRGNQLQGLFPTGVLDTSFGNQGYLTIQEPNEVVFKIEFLGSSRFYVYVKADNQGDISIIQKSF